jgi:exodeoxyribonuclease X
MIVRCIDIETCGLGPEDGVCEVGWCDVLANPSGGFTVGLPHGRFVDPGRPIPPAASAIHHIVDADVVGSPALAEVLAEAVHGAPVLAAHVAKFERQFVAVQVPWVCTWKVAVRLAPNAPEYKLQTLRYWCKLAVDRGLASPPHRAGPDAYVCALLLARMLGKMPIAEMVKVSAAPVLLPRFGFGKHAGVALAEVPVDYLDWIVNKSGMTDEDVLHTARHYQRMVG